MKVQRKKKRGSMSTIRSPQRHKLRELRSRAALEQISCIEPANFPGFEVGVEAEPCMIDMLGVASWMQQDMDSTILFNAFNPSPMDLSALGIDLETMGLLSQACYLRSPGPLPGLSSHPAGFSFPAGSHSSENSEMTSPSSQTDSLYSTNASLPHDNSNRLV
ncbi:hypothetical protein TrVFT333_006897 [Trichoderma virens FT-333]|nr:hypothetical protein TrVFT333_006897 [Trichoderma virens FT-333]